MKVEFLYYEDCPSHEAALERLQIVMQELGVEEEIRVTKVETEQAASDLRFVGSPTIRINGRDIDPPPADEPFRLACRIYHLEDGRISPLPSEQMLQEALAGEIRPHTS